MEYPDLDQKRIIEIFLGLCLIILLIILVFTVTNSAGSKSAQSTTTISNSFNTYNLEYNYNNYDRDSQVHYKNLEYRHSAVDYDTDSDHEAYRGIGGHEINKYIVYVENEGASRYFTVTFNFEDRDSRERSYSVTKYVARDEEVKFTFTDVNDRFDDWDYEVDY